MKEVDPIHQDIVQYERFIEDVLADIHHPVNNRSHPSHQESVKVFNALVDRLDGLRTEWLVKD